MAFRHLYSGQATFGQWHMMDARRIAEIAEAVERQEEEKRKQRLQQDVAVRLEKLFKDGWSLAYQNDSPEAIAGRLFLLRQGIVDRNWDFYLGEQAGSVEAFPRHSWRPGYVMALITLKCVCVGTEADVVACVRSQGSLVGWAASSHDELLGELESKSFAPTTPPLNQQQMAMVLDISPDKFRGQYRDGKWATKDPVTKHARKWWHVDKTEQLRILAKIREAYPEKIWSKNRPENINPVSQNGILVQ